jgi:hypothetical protein
MKAEVRNPKFGMNSPEIRPLGFVLPSSWAFVIRPSQLPFPFCGGTSPACAVAAGRGGFGLNSMSCRQGRGHWHALSGPEACANTTGGAESVHVSV